MLLHELGVSRGLSRIGRLCSALEGVTRCTMNTVTETMLWILTGNTIVYYTRIVAPRRRNCQLKDTAMRFFPLTFANSDNNDDNDDNDDVDNVDDNNLEG